MKKLLTLLLAFTIVFALACPVFAEAENFLTDQKWDKGTAENVSFKDGVATATGFKAKYSAPDVDILPAIKDAIGDEDEVEITIVFDARVNFKGGESGSTEAMMLIRGTNGIAGLNGADNQDAWLEAYDESLDGEDRFFSNSSGNILKYISNTIEITDEWQTYSTNIFVYSAQVNNPSVIKWRFTLDRFTTFEQFESLEIRNLQLVLAEDADDILPPEDDIDPPADEKPATDDKPATNDKPATDEKPATDDKPATEPTQKPAVQTPGANGNLPSNNENGGNATVNVPALLISAGVCSVIIIVACVVAVIIVKKKTSK